MFLNIYKDLFGLINKLGCTVCGIGMQLAKILILNIYKNFYFLRFKIKVVSNSEFEHNSLCSLQ